MQEALIPRARSRSMTTLRMQLAGMAAGLWGAWRHICNAPPGFRVLMYHAVGSTIPEDRLGLYSLRPELFRAQIETLVAASARRPVMPFDVSAFADTGTAITFDDGYHDTLSTAAPILCAAGLPFTVFVSTAYLNSGDPLYLSPADLRELAAMPEVTIGSHGTQHVRLTDCNETDLRDALSTSKSVLENILQKPVTTLSYPHGAVNERVRDAAIAAGYTLAACSKFGPIENNRDLMRLNRIDIWSSDTVPRFLAKLSGDWDWMSWRG
jgi:peptidoglycan/xylan/chitin deacetylase (PgdA/CDA1 family)